MVVLLFTVLASTVFTCIAYEYKTLLAKPLIIIIILNIQLNDNHTVMLRLVSIESTHNFTRFHMRGPTQGIGFLFPPLLPPIGFFPSRCPRCILFPHHCCYFCRADITSHLFIYWKVNVSPIPENIVRISPMDQFGYMYAIKFLSGGYKMFQRKIFDTSHDTSIFTTNIK